MKKRSRFCKVPIAVLLSLACVSLFVACPDPVDVEKPTLTDSVPKAPQGVRIVASAGQITLSWKAPADPGIVNGALGSITAYTVYYSESKIVDPAASGVTKIDAGTKLTVDITGLSDETVYHFVITATNKTGEGARTEAMGTPSKGDTVPGAPQGVKVVAGDAQVSVSWSAPADYGIVDGAAGTITTYTVYYSESKIDDLEASSVTGKDTGISTVADITGLTNGTTYHFLVTATNKTGESERSESLATKAGISTPPEAPRGIVMEEGDGEITLYWRPPGDGGLVHGIEANLNYTVYYSESEIEAPGASGTKKMEADGKLVATITGLTNEVLYYFLITASNETGEGPGAGATGAPRVPDRVPGAPQGLSIVETESGDYISWSPPDDRGGFEGSTPENLTYKVYYSDKVIENLEGVDSLDAGTKLATIVPGLTAGTEYHFVVIASNGTGSGSPSTEVTFTPEKTSLLPSAPTNLYGAPWKNSVVLTWSKPNAVNQEITHYTVYYSEEAIHDLSAEGVSSQNAGTELTYEVADLTAEREYHFVVTASNVVGEGPISNAIRLRLEPNSPPSAPRDLKATPGFKKITLSWKAPADTGIYVGKAGVTGSYIIYFSESEITDLASSDVSSMRVSGTTTMLVVKKDGLLDRDLVNGKQYYFAVAATNQIGDGVPAVITGVPSDESAVPGHPFGLEVSALDAGVTLSWLPPINTGNHDGILQEITGYRVYFSTSPITYRTDLTARGVGKIFFGMEDVHINPNHGMVRADIENLRNGVEYHFVVTAFNVAGEGDRSLAIKATPLGSAVPGAPRNITITPGNRQVTVKWTAPAFSGSVNGSVVGIQRYTVYYSENEIDDLAADGTGKVEVGGTKLTAVVTGLTNGTGYYFALTATNKVGEGERVDADATGTPFVDDAVPSPPVEVEAFPGDGYVTVYWKAPEQPGYYQNNDSVISGYTVYYSESSINDLAADGVEKLEAAGTARQADIPGRVNGTRYHFVITATSQAGEGTKSAGATATPGKAFWIDTGNLRRVGVDEQLTLAAIVNDGGRGGEVTWSSSKEAIATVDADGVVRGLALGETVITATLLSTSETITITITVGYYRIGETGPAGGIVFYDKGKYSDGWRYMEVSTIFYNNYIWAEGSYDEKGRLLGTLSRIGNGKANTEKIVRHYGMTSAKPTAPLLCLNHIENGYDDWFLPSRYELNELYLADKAAGGKYVNAATRAGKLGPEYFGLMSSTEDGLGYSYYFQYFAVPPDSSKTTGDVNVSENWYSSPEEATRAASPVRYF